MSPLSCLLSYCAYCPFPFGSDLHYKVFYSVCHSLCPYPTLQACSKSGYSTHGVVLLADFIRYRLSFLLSRFLFCDSCCARQNSYQFSLRKEFFLILFAVLRHILVFLLQCLLRVSLALGTETSWTACKDSSICRRRRFWSRQKNWRSWATSSISSRRILLLLRCRQQCASLSGSAC